MTERGGRENGRGETEDWEGDNEEGIGERGAVEEEKNGGTKGVRREAVCSRDAPRKGARLTEKRIVTNC